MLATGFGAGPLRRIGLPEEVVAPAGDGVVGPDRARMQAAYGDGLEPARRRIGLPEVVAAPAGDGVVGLDRARMQAAYGDGLEGEHRAGPPVPPGPTSRAEPLTRLDPGNPCSHHPNTASATRRGRGVGRPTLNP